MHIIDAMGTCTMANAVLEYIVSFLTKMGRSRTTSIDLGEMICADLTMAMDQVYHRRRPTAKGVSRLGTRMFHAKKRVRGIAGKLIHEEFDHLERLKHWG